MRILMLFAFVVGFGATGGWVGCAKKSATTTAGATGGMGDTSGSGISESGTEGLGAGAGSSSGLPVVYFEFDQYTVRTADQSLLQKAAETLKKSNAPITIEGHCDERGSVEYNLALGERRAQSVKGYLQKLGVDGKRLNTLSFGEERPADSSSSEGAWTKNRRAELLSSK